MVQVNITIDGKKLKAEALQTVYEAATANGIYIPALCHHPALPPEGACRVCLVEIERQRALQPACTFPVTEGLVIHTNSPKVREARKFVLELIISDHPLDCMTCEATGDCRLQDLAYEYEVKGDEYTGGVQHDYPIDDPNPFIQVDRNKCILCRRCVRACNYINGVEAIGIVYRGFKARIAFGMDSTMEDSPCEFCGSCVEVCPTAALWPKMSMGKGRAWQLKKVETTCSYCGVGCQLNLHVRRQRDRQGHGRRRPGQSRLLLRQGPLRLRLRESLGSVEQAAGAAVSAGGRDQSHGRSDTGSTDRQAVTVIASASVNPHRTSSKPTGTRRSTSSPASSPRPSRRTAAMRSRRWLRPAAPTRRTS